MDKLEMGTFETVQEQVRKAKSAPLMRTFVKESGGSLEQAPVAYLEPP